MIEGDFNQTFGERNEVNQKFLLSDCTSWISVGEARWKSYSKYINTLTQTSPYLGILPCLLGLSAIERRGLRDHYNRSAKLLRLELQELEQKQSKTATSEQEELYFRDQQTLLHNFLREVAVLTQRSTHEALPVETPISTLASSNSQSDSPIVSLPLTLPSPPSFPVDTDAKEQKKDKDSQTAVPSGVVSSGFTFFQRQKPTVIKNETPPELKTRMNPFQKLFEEHKKYTFMIKRSQADQLTLQFTARKNVSEDEDEIIDQLQPASTILRKLANASGMSISSNQFTLDWRKWTLTIDATPAEIDGITWLLQQASGKSMTHNNNSSDHEAVCKIQ